MSRRDYARLMDRDGGACLHCGTDAGLVPQHRMGRGMGGSRLLEIPANVVLMCSWFNGRMEDDIEAASLGLAMGWKLGRFPTDDILGRILGSPVFDRNTGLWYTLDNDWSRTVHEHIP